MDKTNSDSFIKGATMLWYTCECTFLTPGNNSDGRGKNTPQLQLGCKDNIIDLTYSNLA